MSSLLGRRILITGASSGIGLAVAHAAVAAGARVGLLARRADKLDAAVAELGPAAVAASADVTDAEQLRVAVDSIAKQLGGLDGLLNNAGVFRAGGPATIDLDEAQMMFDVNVVGLVAATQAALPHLRDAPRADIVNLSSMSGRRIASVTGAVYSASKFAVHALSHGMRMEFAAEPIRVTIVAPGFVTTPLADELTSDDGKAFREILVNDGMTAESLAGFVIQAFAAPPDTDVVEIAILPASK